MPDASEAPPGAEAPSPGSGGVAAVLGEAQAGERRVALVPDDVDKLRRLDLEVIVEPGAGSGAFIGDDLYEKSGAHLASRAECLARADVVLTVDGLADDDLSHLRPGQVLVGLLAPLINPARAARLADLGVTAVSLDTLPRTLSRAQSMDALTSQASVAGYKAAVVAADAFGRYFPLLMTAAGTAAPAEVLVLGAGVAGLQAIATARRLGAQVRGYDVRPEAKEQVESLGARFLELASVSEAAGEGGYARALSADEARAQQAELNTHVARHDVVITTAQVPGGRPPLLISAEALSAMRAGSVVVDMAASALGGNVEGSLANETVVTANGVTVIGAGALPSAMASAASAAYSHNVCALLAHLVRDGHVEVDLSDEIQQGVVISHAGSIVHVPTATLLEAGKGGVA